jgi:hypothetical protein
VSILPGLPSLKQVEEMKARRRGMQRKSVIYTAFSCRFWRYKSKFTDGPAEFNEYSLGLSNIQCISGSSLGFLYYKSPMQV